jgi:hypothetical protein
MAALSARLFAAANGAGFRLALTDYFAASSNGRYLPVAVDRQKRRKMR